mmetsp:Transcript_16930/g.37643  ORF Transcript_16930/g.37643 Transcript_16930/m.37643 type:complete len:202 (+) Transcript_16930:1140-1745(+)
MYPLSKRMPSMTSSSFCRVFPSWMVITPSLPTRSMASLRRSPMARSPLAEMVPTCAISSLVVISLEISSNTVTILSTASCAPLLRSMGFMPAATALQPSLKMALVSTVAVVVPSPAVSLVREATWRTSCAPMFMNLSLNSMCLATVTPSFVILGGPKLWSRMALRPLGPRVTCTASASLFTPSSILCLPSTPKRTSLPMPM